MVEAMAHKAQQAEMEHQTPEVVVAALAIMAVFQVVLEALA